MTTHSLHDEPNLRDVFFNLFELHDIGRTSLGRGPFAAMDEATAKEALRSVEKLCVNELQKSFVEADRVPLTRDAEGNVVEENIAPTEACLRALSMRTAPGQEPAYAGHPGGRLL